MGPGKMEVYQEERATIPPGERRSGEPQWRWRVKARNGEIVATGESYRDKTDAYRGFEDAARTMASTLCSVEYQQQRLDDGQ